MDDRLVTTSEAAAILGFRTDAGVRMLVLRRQLEPLDRTARPLVFRESDVIDLEFARRSRADRDRLASLAEQWRADTPMDCLRR